MDRKLAVQALIKFVLGTAFMAALLFLSAGTLRWARGWLFLAILCIPMVLMGAVLLIHSPGLLRKRLQSREREPAQRAVIALGGLMFIAGFAAAGLTVRFGWYQLPRWVSAAASILFLMGYGMYAEVLRENAYLSRTVEVREGQEVVDTGLYGTVRHPMYAATLLLFLMTPLILGSPASLVVFLVYPFLLVVRIRSEEALLLRELPGYEDYRNRVKYRLIPHLW